MLFTVLAFSGTLNCKSTIELTAAVVPITGDATCTAGTSVLVLATTAEVAAIAVEHRVVRAVEQSPRRPPLDKCARRPRRARCEFKRISVVEHIHGAGNSNVVLGHFKAAIRGRSVDGQVGVNGNGFVDIDAAGSVTRTRADHRPMRIRIVQAGGELAGEVGQWRTGPVRQAAGRDRGSWLCWTARA